MAAATVSSNKDGSESGARSTHQAPSGYWGRAASATASASRVLPTPPIPVSDRRRVVLKQRVDGLDFARSADETGQLGRKVVARRGMSRRWRDGLGLRRRVLSQVLVVGTGGLGARLNPELANEHRRAGIVAAHDTGPVATACVNAHQGAIGLFAQRVVPEQALRIQDRLAMIVGRLRLIDDAVQDLETELTHALALAEHPIVVHTFEQIAAVQIDRFRMPIRVAGEALELGQVEPAVCGRVPLE